MKLIFVIVSRAVPVLSLSRQEPWRKDAEILILRHQPVERLAAMRLIATPGTILRWHRDMVRRRRARVSRRGRS
ncbi:MAG: hypothetical protein M3Y33_02830, partial [Actinomycetota bacterium]|nr:hypothetical protein [Actinomycetota bacterium]